MNFNTKDFNILIKKEFHDSYGTIENLPTISSFDVNNEINLGKVPDSKTDPPLLIDASKPIELYKNQICNHPSDNMTSPSILKKRKINRKRHVYSKPKKRKKKQDSSMNLIGNFNPLNMKLKKKLKDKNFSECSSDTIILGDLNEETISSNMTLLGDLPKEIELPPPELGRLLISDGMISSCHNKASKRKYTNSCSKGKHAKIKNSKAKDKMEEIQDGREDPPLLVPIKKEFENMPESNTELPISFETTKETISISSENKSIQDVALSTFSFSTSSNIVLSNTIKRKPQTARRGKKKLISNERPTNENLNQNSSLTYDDVFLKNADLLPNQFNNLQHCSEKGIFPYLDLPGNSIAEKTEKKKASLKRKNIVTSVSVNTNKKTVNSLSNDQTVQKIDSRDDLLDSSCSNKNSVSKIKKKICTKNKNFKTDVLNTHISSELGKCDNIDYDGRNDDDDKIDNSIYVSTFVEAISLKGKCKNSKSDSASLNSKKTSMESLYYTCEMVELCGKNFHTNSSNWMSSEKQNYLTPSVSMSFEVDSSINEDYFHNISILPFEKESLKLNSNKIIKDLHKSDEVLVPEDNPRNNLSERNSKINIQSITSLLPSFDITKVKKEAEVEILDTNDSYNSSMNLKDSVTIKKEPKDLVEKEKYVLPGILLNKKAKNLTSNPSDTSNLEAAASSFHKKSSPDDSLQLNKCNQRSLQAISLESSTTPDKSYQTLCTSSDPNVSLNSYVINNLKSTQSTSKSTFNDLMNIPIKEEPNENMQIVVRKINCPPVQKQSSNESEREKTALADVFKRTCFSNEKNNISSTLNVNKLVTNELLKSNKHDKKMPQVVSLKSITSSDKNNHSLFAANATLNRLTIDNFEDTQNIASKSTCNILVDIKIKEEPEKDNLNAVNEVRNISEIQIQSSNESEKTTCIDIFKKSYLSKERCTPSLLDINKSSKELLNSNGYDQEMLQAEALCVNSDKNVNINDHSKAVNSVFSHHIYDNLKHPQSKASDLTHNTLLDIQIKKEPEEAIENINSGINNSTLTQIQLCDAQKDANGKISSTEIPMRISQFNEGFQSEIHQQEVSQVCISSVGTNINAINDHAVSITKLHKDVIHNNQSVNISEDNQNKVSESSINFSIKRGLNQEEMASNVEKNLNTITTCSGITGDFTCFADKFSEKDIRNGIDASNASQNSVESTDLNTAFIPTRFIKQELCNDINADTVNIFCQSSSNNRMDEDSPVNIQFASNKHSSIDPKILQIEDDSNSLCLSKLFSSEKFNKKTHHYSSSEISGINRNNPIKNVGNDSVVEPNNQISTIISEKHNLFNQALDDKLIPNFIASNNIDSALSILEMTNLKGSVNICKSAAPSKNSSVETINPITINFQKNSKKFFQQPYVWNNYLNKSETKNQYYNVHMNLSIRDVKKRLLKTKRIFLKNTDLLSSDNFPVLEEEAECYHRLVMTVPSFKLISRCIKTSVKPLIDINNSIIEHDIANHPSPSITESNTAFVSNQLTTDKISFEKNDKCEKELSDDIKYKSLLRCKKPEKSDISFADDASMVNSAFLQSTENTVQTSDSSYCTSNNFPVLNASMNNLTSKDLQLIEPSISEIMILDQSTISKDSFEKLNTSLLSLNVTSSEIHTDSKLTNSLDASVIENSVDKFKMKMDAILENSSSSIKFSKNINVINAVDDDKLNLSNLNDFSEVQKYSNNDVSSKEMSCDIQNSLIEQKSLNKCNHSTLQISKEKCIQNSFDYNTESQMYKLPPKLSIDSTESLSRISHQEFTKTGSEGNELPHLEYSVSEGVLSNRCSDENEELVKHAFPEERAVNDLIDEKVSPSLSFLQQNSAIMENNEFLPTFNAQNSISSPVLNMVDVPTTELLKILQTVNNLPSSEFSHKSLSKNKTYSPNSAPQIIDYDHGMSSDNRHLNLDRENSYSNESFLKFPVVHDYGHKPIKDTNKDNCNSKEVFPAARNTVSITESTVSTCSKSEYSSDTDVDCSNDVPGSPFESHCDDQNANISKKNSDEKKEEAVKSSEDKDCKNIPQYKSRWEKIMERKSLENSSKEKFNEHLLKDYFPIKLLKQKSNIQKPIAHVQPCSKISPKNIPHVNKSLFSKETFKKDKIHSSKSKAIVDKNNSSTKNKSLEEASNLFKKDKIVKKKQTKHFVDNKKRENSSITLSKESIKVKKDKIYSPKSKRTIDEKKKSSIKSKSVDEVSNLFKPDKIVTQKKTKLSNDNERNRENSSTARLLNRITNRGSFLTQASVNQSPKSKIYTHKKNKNKNKGVSKGKIYADELHMMIHSPKIEIPSINKAAASHVSKSNDNNRKIASFTELNMERVMSPSENSVENSLICQNFVDSNKTVISLAYDNSFKSSKHYSNSFISESVSSNLPSVFQNTSQNNNCFPFDLPSSSSLKIGVKRPLLGRRTLLPTPSFHTYKNINKDEFWTSSPNLNTPRNDFDNEISSPIQSPLLTDSSVDFNVNSPYFSSPHSVHLPSSHLHNRNNHHRHSRSRQSKCVCLPPRLLKTSVGNAVFDTINVLLLILEWNVDWLAQQQKIHDPPPISTSTKKIVNVYENRDDYYNTYFPLMLLETWQRIYMSWTHLHQACPYFCEITSYKVETHSIKVECQAVFRSSDAERGYFPEEGNIIMVKFGTKDKGGIKILGYIQDVKVKLFDAGNDPQNMSYQALKYTSGESLKLLLLTFTSAYTSEDFDMSHLVRIQVLCNVKPTLKQNDAMLNIKDSPLFKNILNPLSDGLRTATVAMRNVDPVIIKENVSKSVKDILQGILSPHPLPLLTIANSLPSSDRLLVLPPLLEKMKHSYKTKVLLCTRTTKALTDIGFNLCGGTINFVIIGKPIDVHQKLRKYLLDDLAAKTLNEGHLINEESKGRLLENTKIDIIKNCDVILSLIRNSHNDFVVKACEDDDCIAQMCCIIDEANLCTEPEILIPLLYGMSKLILIGDPDVHAKVCSKTAANFDYNRSLFHRAYELDQL